MDYYGDDCRRRYGRPDTILRMAQAFIDGGEGLDALEELLSQAVTVAIQRWNSPAARQFQQALTEVLDTVKGNGLRAIQVAQAAQTFAANLEKAFDQAMETYSYAEDNGYIVWACRDPFPIREDPPPTPGASEEIYLKLFQANSIAGMARLQFVRDIGQNEYEKSKLTHLQLRADPSVLPPWQSGGGIPTGRILGPE